MKLNLPDSLENQRDQIAKSILEAHQIVKDFASKYGWENFTNESFADHAEIFATQNDFIARLEEMYGMEISGHLPKTVVASLENRILMAVSPDEYLRIFPQGNEEKAFEKLLAHEIGHRLHVRILHGNEEAMGPIWFFEAFAILVAGQFENTRIEMSEVGTTISGTERGNYLKYGATLRYLLQFYSLKELVARAGDENFSKNLLEELADRENL
jgi:hypothetical protein